MLVWSILVDSKMSLAVCKRIFENNENSNNNNSNNSTGKIDRLQPHSTSFVLNRQKSVLTSFKTGSLLMTNKRLLCTLLLLQFTLFLNACDVSFFMVILMQYTVHFLFFFLDKISSERAPWEGTVNANVTRQNVLNRTNLPKKSKIHPRRFPSKLFMRKFSSTLLFF